MLSKYEVDTIVKGIKLSWTTWGKMRGERLVLGPVSYLKSENGRGFERIFSVDIEEDQTRQIQRMIAGIKAGSMPDSMLITPNTKPSDLAELLSREGFIIDDADPCMMMRLDDLKGESGPTDGFAISGVLDIERLADWLAIVNKALFGCELVTLEQFNDVLALNNTRFYLGSINNTPVTACMTIADGDTSVLEMVATLEEHRRKGYASRVVTKALSDLREKGIKTISLRAEADGVGVYKRLGFHECFQRVVATYSRDEKTNP